MFQYLIKQPLLWALLGVNLLLLGLILAAMWTDWGSASIAASDSAVSMPDTADYSADVSSLAQFGAQPLFHSDRKATPIREAVPVPEPVGAALEDYRLTGMVTGGAGGKAYLRHRATGDTLALEVGGQLLNWTLTSVESGHITLTKNGNEVVMEMNNETP